MAGCRRPSLTGQDRQADGSSTEVSGHTQTLIFRVGVLHVSALPRPVFANTALVRPGADRVAPAKMGGKPPHADSDLAREPRIDGSGRALEYAITGDDDGEYFCRVLLASSGVRFVP